MAWFFSPHTLSPQLVFFMTFVSWWLDPRRLQTELQSLFRLSTATSHKIGLGLREVEILYFLGRTVVICINNPPLPFVPLSIYCMYQASQVYVEDSTVSLVWASSILPNLTCYSSCLGSLAPLHFALHLGQRVMVVIPSKHILPNWYFHNVCSEEICSPDSSLAHDGMTLRQQWKIQKQHIEKV
jgi:hypothetical protein